MAYSVSSTENNAGPSHITHRGLSALSNVITKLRTARKLDTLDEIVNEILLFNCVAKNWALLLNEQMPQQHIIRFAFVHNRARRKLYNRTINIDDGILKWSLDNLQSLHVAQIENDSRFNKQHDAILGQEHSIGNSFIIPLITADKKSALGILVLYNLNIVDEVSYYHDLLTAIVNVLSLTIEKLETIRAIERETLTDHLTSLFNRRALIQITEREIEECIRYNRYISFVIIDVDNFKAINDTEGHLQGDAVLVRLADILRDSVRKLDYVIRFAGDEFVILMPDTFQEQMQEIVERLMGNFAKRRLPSKVDYSISVGTYSGPPRTLNYMFGCADKEMYMKKKVKKRHPARVHSTMGALRHR